MGKLIVHWSPLHGQGKTTASMGAIALAMSLMAFGERICVTHTQDDMSDLEGMFDNRPSQEQKKILYQVAGWNALIKNIKREKLTPTAIEDCTIETTIKNLALLVGIEKEESSTNTDEIDDLVYKIMIEHIKTYYDWTFVDLAAGKNQLSKKFMEVADFIVVTLSQNCGIWDLFFEQYSDIAQKKNVFYLFGGYRQESIYHRKNFAMIYQKQGVKQNRIGVVPDNVGYMDAIANGTIGDFFVENMKAKKKEENVDFIQECQATARKIRKAVLREGEEKERTVSYV